MKKTLFIAGLLISNFAAAISRPEQLALCSGEARKTLKNDYFPSDNLNHKLLGLTTWLSAENSVPPQQFEFTHIAKVQLLNGKLMHWDFQSTTQVNESACRLTQQIKRSEYEISPPDDCDSCDDNQD